MFLGVNMFDLCVTIWETNPEVMILDHDVLHKRSHFQRHCECDCILVVFVNCDWIFEKTSQYRRGVSSKLEYEINFLCKTHNS